MRYQRNIIADWIYLPLFHSHPSLYPSTTGFAGIRRIEDSKNLPRSATSRARDSEKEFSVYIIFTLVSVSPRLRRREKRERRSVTTCSPSETKRDRHYATECITSGSKVATDQCVPTDRWNVTPLLTSYLEIIDIWI